MRRRVIVGVAALLTVVAWAPGVSVVVASLVARWAGCELDEATVHPCRIGPVDAGGLLNSLGVAGWLFLATWPLALASVLFWLGYGIVAIVRVVRRR
jgi:hypothetical protein